MYIYIYVCLNWNKGSWVEKLTRTQKRSSKQGVAAHKRSHPVCISIVFYTYFHCISIVFLFAKQGAAANPTTSNVYFARNLAEAHGNARFWAHNFSIICSRLFSIWVVSSLEWNCSAHIFLVLALNLHSQKACTIIRRVYNGDCLSLITTNWCNFSPDHWSSIARRQIGFDFLALFSSGKS